MDEELKQKLLRFAIIALEVGQGHLKMIEYNSLAEEVGAIFTRCSTELHDMVPYPEPGTLMNRD